MHQLTYAYNACTAQWSANFELRRQLDELSLSIQSTPITKTSILTSLRADAYALKALDTFQFFGCFFQGLLGKWLSWGKSPAKVRMLCLEVGMGCHVVMRIQGPDGWYGTPGYLEASSRKNRLQNGALEATHSNCFAYSVIFSSIYIYTVYIYMEGHGRACA